MWNPGIISLGIDKTINAIKEFSTYKDNKEYALISVGSGLGFIEKRISQCIGNELILIDPYPYSYYQRETNKEFSSIRNLSRLPDYDLVDTLIEKRPNIINNCIILLNWCYNDNYDYKAILLLKPLAIFSIYEYSEETINNTSGSNDFCQFTEYIKRNKVIDHLLINKEDLNYIKLVSNHYKLLKYYNSIGPNDNIECGHNDIKIEWYQLNIYDDIKDTNESYKQINETFKCLHDHNNYNNKMLVDLEKRVKFLRNEVKKEQELKTILKAVSDKDYLSDLYRKDYPSFIRKINSIKELSTYNIKNPFTTSCICGIKDCKLVCNRCKIQYYCSDKCHKGDWVIHKQYCITK